MKRNARTVMEPGTAEGRSIGRVDQPQALGWV